MDGQELGTVTSVESKRGARRKYTRAERARIVAESYAAGVTVREVAERHGVRPNLLTYWRMRSGAEKRRAKQPSAVQFAELRVSEREAQDGYIEIDLSSGCLRVRGRIDRETLNEVLAALR